MLKKKLQSLVQEKNFSAQGKFTIISDTGAAQVTGGAGKECPSLASCYIFSGVCPNLSSCFVFA